MTANGHRLPLWAWIVGPMFAVIVVVVLVALLREGEEPADPGELDEPGPRRSTLEKSPILGLA